MPPLVVGGSLVLGLYDLSGVLACRFAPALVGGLPGVLGLLLALTRRFLHRLLCSGLGEGNHARGAAALPASLGYPLHLGGEVFLGGGKVAHHVSTLLLALAFVARFIIENVEKLTGRCRLFSSIFLAKTAEEVKRALPPLALLRALAPPLAGGKQELGLRLPAVLLTPFAGITVLFVTLVLIFAPFPLFLLLFLLIVIAIPAVFLLDCFLA
mmetsp:Transcript_30709/g.57218  ORF Transcript_30709/g.57218 Transcript_30709/m.57218 type:complete len:212 (-) Transcript_30709:531-1166(-)